MKISSKVLKIVTSLLLTFALVGANMQISYAGTTPPNKKNYIDLSQDLSSVSFQIKRMKYGNLFTNSSFTNVSNVVVSVGKITINKNGSKTKSTDMIVHLHQVGAKIDKTKKVSTSGGTVTFSGLNKKSKYYLQFSKKNDRQIYSFSGNVKMK